MILEKIDNFFKAYKSFWESEYEIPADQLYLADDTMVDWANSIKLSSPVIDDTQIIELENAFERKVQFPDYYKYFLKKYSYERIEIPLINFISTQGINQLKEVYSYFSNSNSIPFAQDQDGVGVLLLNTDDYKIYFSEYSDLENVQLILPSFEILMDMLTLIIQSDDKGDKLKLEVQSLDEGFQETWDWWENRFLYL